MAQVNTGLGWSAKDIYLIQSAGEVARQSYYSDETNFPGQPLPYFESGVPSIQDVANLGMTVGRYKHNTNYEIRILSCVQNAFACRSSSNTDDCYVLVPTTSPDWNTKRAYWVAYSPSDGSFMWQFVQYFDFTTNYINNDVRWGRMYNMNASTDNRLPIHSIDTTLANIIVNAAHSVIVRKLNPGYAVCCVATWYTIEGTTLVSPVLISNFPDFTLFTLDGTTPYPNQTTFDFLHDGMRFYMTVIPGNDKPFTTAFPNVDLRQFSVAAPSKVFALIAAESFANILVTETVDPYEDFGNSGEDAGETDPDPEDDDIEEDDLPTTSFADAGFCRIYRPSLSQINDLSNYLWTDQTFLQTVINHLKQIIENPIDAIISLSLVPCTPPVSSDVEVKVMYIPTGVYMPPVINQFVEVDCGTFALKEMYGSALDYNPYTSVQLYLPYVGIVQLDTDEVMGKTIHVGYRIDVVTGVCCAYVKANNDVLYQFSGHCSIQQPITSADFSGYVGAAIAAGKLVASIAAAGAGAPEVAATLAGAPTPSISGTSSETRITERNEATGRQITAGTRRKETVTENPGASFGEVATRGVSNTVGAVMNSKTIIQHSGGFSGNSGYLAAVRRPYLIVTRPRIANPEKYGQFNGRPSMVYLNLGSCTGFTQVQSIQLTGINATNPELSEITTLLTSGVIF